jgi:hypothetical protein
MDNIKDISKYKTHSYSSCRFIPYCGYLCLKRFPDTRSTILQILHFKLVVTVHHNVSELYVAECGFMWKEIEMHGVLKMTFHISGILEANEGWIF